MVNSFNSVGDKKMRKIARTSAAVILSAACWTAMAGPPPSEAPTMSFRVLPSTTKFPSSDHSVMPYRINDLIQVVVNDPIRCGQTPVSPTFRLESGTLKLHYDLTPAAQNAAGCTVMTEFTIRNAPHQDLAVEFSGGPETPSVAAMQKCPKYDPKDADVWECLHPDVKAAPK
jgi:hypothetical protein